MTALFFDPRTEKTACETHRGRLGLEYPPLQADRSKGCDFCLYREGAVKAFAWGLETVMSA